MTKNEYRRSLILLRSNESGYSGHVRLERRVTTGSMVFALQTPKTQDTLRAALVGRDKRGYYACAVGDIRRDARGQGTLTFTFDPRNVCGRELDMYRLIAVVRSSQSGCALVLLGNLNGYADMDLQPALAAVCALYGSAADALPVPDIASVLPPETEAEEAPQLPEAQTESEAPEAPEAADTAADDAPAQAQTEEETLKSAAEMLGDAADAPWPIAIENARGYFRDQSAAEDVPDDEHIYVRVPVDGLDAHLLIGVRAENGQIAGISYALPADYSDDPPEGFADYRWQGDDAAGWWVLRIEAE